MVTLPGTIWFRIALALSAVPLAMLAWGSLTGHYILVGVLQEQTRWQAAERAQLQQSIEVSAENFRLAHRAAEASLASAASERTFADQLTKERRHAVLVQPIHSAHAAVSCVAGAADDRAQPVGADVAGLAAGPGPEAAPAGTLADPRLTVAAVWLWDAALAGTDAAAERSVPADPCRADDPASSSCVAGSSSVTLAEAWDNQALNALSCRLDRQRYQRLIDLLKAREAQQTTVRDD